MKNVILGLGALLLLAGSTATANAQYVYGYAPTVAPAYYAAPVVVAPRRAYYAPAPVYAAPVAPASYYAPAPVYSSYYAPAPVYAQPVVVARYGRSLYGTRQVYYPGQPVLNTWRAITP